MAAYQGFAALGKAVEFTGDTQADAINRAMIASLAVSTDQGWRCRVMNERPRDLKGRRF